VAGADGPAACGIGGQVRVYKYVYIEREREIEYICISLYIHKERERLRERLVDSPHSAQCCGQGRPSRCAQRLGCRYVYIYRERER